MCFPPAKHALPCLLSLRPSQPQARAVGFLPFHLRLADVSCYLPCRLTFWWSNILQLRWMFWALGQGPDAAVAAAAGGDGGSSWPPPAAATASGSAGGRVDELADQQGSGAYWSPRAALAAAGTKHGLDWMQASGAEVLCVAGGDQCCSAHLCGCSRCNDVVLCAACWVTMHPAWGMQLRRCTF